MIRSTFQWASGSNRGKFRSQREQSSRAADLWQIHSFGMQAHKPRDFSAGLLPGVAARIAGRRGLPQRSAVFARVNPQPGGIPCSFFVNLQGLYFRLPAQAGYGDKWPS